MTTPTISAPILIPTTQLQEYLDELYATDLFAPLKAVSVDYPADLLEARRAEFVAQIEKSGSADTLPEGL
jgi:hypothetical protein